MEMSLPRSRQLRADPKGFYDLGSSICRRKSKSVYSGTLPREPKKLATTLSAASLSLPSAQPEAMVAPQPEIQVGHPATRPTKPTTAVAAVH